MTIIGLILTISTVIALLVINNGNFIVNHYQTYSDLSQAPDSDLSPKQVKIEEDIEILVDIVSSMPTNFRTGVKFNGTNTYFDVSMSNNYKSDSNVMLEQTQTPISATPWSDTRFKDFNENINYAELMDIYEAGTRLVGRTCFKINNQTLTGNFMSMDTSEYLQIEILMREYLPIVVNQVEVSTMSARVFVSTKLPDFSDSKTPLKHSIQGPFGAAISMISQFEYAINIKTNTLKVYDDVLGALKSSSYSYYR